MFPFGNKFALLFFRSAIFILEGTSVMLKLKHLFENYALARTALAHWEHDEDTLDDMLSRFRISSNAIYPFRQNGAVCFLRLAPTDEKLARNVIGEMELIEYLIRNDFPALKPVPTKDGAVCLTLHTEWGDYYATAFRKVRGVQIEATNYSNEIMFSYGKTLGKLHALSAGFVPVVAKWTHEDALDWIHAVLREYGAGGAMLAEREAVARALAGLPREHYGLVHYDFELDNVFYDEETNSCSVIDFDDGMYHWYALDVEQVFASLAEELSGDALEAATRVFLEGYRTEHAYTAEMDAARPLMRRFIDLYTYARLTRSIAETFGDEPEWLVGLRIKLGNVLASIEAGIRP